MDTVKTMDMSCTCMCIQSNNAAVFANVQTSTLSKSIKKITCPLIKKKVRQVYGVTPSFISQGFGQVVF